MVVRRAERLRHRISRKQWSVTWGATLRPSSVAKSKRGKDECPGSIRVYEQRAAGRARHCHRQRATASRIDGHGGDSAIGNHIRHGKEFAKISELEKKSARRLGGWLHDGSYRAIRRSRRGVNWRTAGQVQEDLFRRISGRTGEGKLAGHYLFCGAANVGEVLRLQSGQQK